MATRVLPSSTKCSWTRNRVGGWRPPRRTAPLRGTRFVHRTFCFEMRGGCGPAGRMVPPWNTGHEVLFPPGLAKGAPRHWLIAMSRGVLARALQELAPLATQDRQFRAIGELRLNGAPVTFHALTLSPHRAAPWPGPRRASACWCSATRACCSMPSVRRMTLRAAWWPTCCRARRGRRAGGGAARRRQRAGAPPGAVLAAGRWGRVEVR